MRQILWTAREQHCILTLERLNFKRGSFFDGINRSEAKPLLATINRMAGMEFAEEKARRRDGEEGYSENAWRNEKAAPNLIWI
jgi:hypothetical protein